jgi:hypothetical protein
MGKILLPALRSSPRGARATSTRAVLHPDVVARADSGPSRPSRSIVIRGAAAAVARQARLGASSAAEVRPVLVNGAAGVVITLRGRPHAVMAFTVAEGKIVEIDTVADPERFAKLAAPVLAGPRLDDD